MGSFIDAYIDLNVITAHFCQSMFHFWYLLVQQFKFMTFKDNCKTKTDEF